MTPLLYAIGREDFVEIRRSRKVPRLEAKVLVKNVPVCVDTVWESCPAGTPGCSVANFWGTGPRQYQILRKIWEDKEERVRIVTIKGGRRLGLPIKKYHFQKWTGHSLADGVIWQIPEKVGIEILKRQKKLLSGATGRP